MWGDGRARRGAMVGQGEGRWRASWTLCSYVHSLQAQQMALTLHDPAAHRPTPWDKSHRNPHRPAWLWPAKHPGLHWACERASLSSSPSHPPVLRNRAVCSFTWIIDLLAAISALAAAAEISVSALRNISLCTQSPIGQPELHPWLLHLGAGMADLAGQAPGWLSQGRTPPSWVKL